jgi:hypothetical protein
MTKKFNYTGITAQALDAPGYWYGGGNYGAVGTNGYGPLGGQAGNNIFGFAQQFEVSELLVLSALNVEATIGPGVGTATFNYKLYLDTANKNGQSVPQNSSLALTSEALSYTKTSQEDLQSSTINAPEKKIAFEITLQPGVYWLAEEGAPGGPAVYVNQSYVEDHSKRPATAHRHG